MARQLTLYLVLIMLVASGMTSQPSSAQSDTSLRHLASATGRYLGAAVKPELLQTDEAYRQTLLNEFNLVVTEDALKMAALRPTQGEYSFYGSDAVISFAQANGLAVRGHVLLWHDSVPAWLSAGNFTREEIMTILHDHITTVVSRYRGVIFAWDVVNEAFNEDGTLRDSFFLRTIGPEYIEYAFQWAAAADPNALLFYNDYSIEDGNPKSDAVFALLSSLRARGIPVHGVGFQSHLQLIYPPNYDSMTVNMQRFAAVGLQIHLTELDVRIQGIDLPTEQLLIEQAEVYRIMTRLCLQTLACTAMITWGVGDRYSWIYEYTGHPDAPLMFDNDFQPKPAYFVMWETLAAAVQQTPVFPEDGEPGVTGAIPLISPPQPLTSPSVPGQ
ncbi:MAG: endo-1,4-beta-xylanase [bacterium]|nr:endo-1,4-beta-xylanase [bacterium]